MTIGIFSREQKKLIRRIVKQMFRPIPHANNLDLLAFIHGTDKWSHGYTEYYPLYFGPRRQQQLTILEIGVGGASDPTAGGASLRMWEEFFPKSKIYSIDIYDKQQHETERIHIFQGSQNDPDFLTQVAKEIGPIDIIIDDGSHVNEHVITSFKTLFPHLVHGGIYVIEDLQTAYLESFGGNPKDLDDQNTSVTMLKHLIDGLNSPYIPNREPGIFDQTVTSIHFYPKIAFIFKGNTHLSSGLNS